MCSFVKVGNDSNDATEKQYFDLLSWGLIIPSNQMAECGGNGMYLGYFSGYASVFYGYFSQYYFFHKYNTKLYNRVKEME